MFTDPTVSDFKAYFVRDFPYGWTLKEVTDNDISSALSDTKLFLNVGLACDQDTYTLLFLLLSAHFLVTNLRNSSQGIAGSYDWLEQSKSVGSVSASYAIPQRILDNPELAMLAKTPYGAKFLFFVLPLLSGQMFSVHGKTHA